MNKENSDTYSVTCSCRRLLFFVLAAALVFGAVCVGGVSGADVWTGSVDTTWAGSGTQADPYLITSAAELAGLAQKVNGGETYSEKYFKLTTDIDLAGKEWTPIGSISGLSVKSKQLYFTTGNFFRPFSGIFDGNKNSISNLFLEPDGGTATGLFGYVNGGTIKNLNLNGEFTKNGVKTSCYINLDPHNIIAGSLVGLLQRGTVDSCFVRDFGLCAPTGNDGNSRIFGGLIGFIIDEETITANTQFNPMSGDITQYVTGGSSAIYVNTGFGKTWGELVGAPTTNNDGKSVSLSYVVKTYIMNQNDGDYDYITSETYYGIIGDTVQAVYTIPEGCSLHVSNENNNLGPVVLSSNGYIFSVYLKRNPVFMIEIPESIVISDSTYWSDEMKVIVNIESLLVGGISITVDSLNNFKLVEKSLPHVTIPYSLYVGTPSNELGLDGNIATYKEKITSLYSTKESFWAIVDETPTYSGEYADTLTFTVQYSETT